MQDEFFTRDSPHSTVKRLLWKIYLDAYIAKTQQSGYRTIIYDVFSGVGTYNDKWDGNIECFGSPLIALHVALTFFTRKRELPNSLLNPRVMLYFNEMDAKNYAALKENVKKMIEIFRAEMKILEEDNNQLIVESGTMPVRCHVTCGEFAKMEPITTNLSDRMITFIDPYGYSQIPMATVARFAGKHKEVFINLMSLYINRFLKVDCAANGIQSTFGKPVDSIIEEIEKTTKKSTDLIAELYADELKKATQSEYPVLTFEMKSIKNSNLYHLLFSSTHIEGIKTMKTAMNKCSQEKGEFSLSDFNILRRNIPLSLKNEQDSSEVKKVIFDKFKGQTPYISDIEKFIWLDTPFVYEKTALKLLKDENLITKVADDNGKTPERDGTFPDGTEWRIKFANGDDLNNMFKQIQLGKRDNIQ